MHRAVIRKACDMDHFQTFEKQPIQDRELTAESSASWQAKERDGSKSPLGNQIKLVEDKRLCTQASCCLPVPHLICESGGSGNHGIIRIGGDPGGAGKDE